MAELDDITLLADILLPGNKNKGWPSASEVVDPNLWKNAVSKPEMLVSFAKQVSGCKLVSRLQLVRKYQENHAHVFGLFLSALTDLYYKSPQVYTSLEKMIDNGPSDPKPLTKAGWTELFEEGKFPNEPFCCEITFLIGFFISPL